MNNLKWGVRVKRMHRDRCKRWRQEREGGKGCIHVEAKEEDEGEWRSGGVPKDCREYTGMGHS
jgi:hypothetical protein